MSEITMGTKHLCIEIVWDITFTGLGGQPSSEL